MKSGTEADLCRAFAETVPSAWTVYNETAGFDMVLVHVTGAQIGIEAKLRLNPKVLVQVIETNPHWNVVGPDFRAVLVGNAGNGELRTLAAALGVTVIELAKNDRFGPAFRSNSNSDSKFHSTPKLPDVEPFKSKSWGSYTTWFDLVPVKRLPLPEYVPDVPAGVPSPAVLGSWKIQAMKVCVFVEKTGAITRSDFKALKIDPGRWMTGHWLAKGATRGVWVKGPQFPADQFRAGHPAVYEQVVADFDKWSAASGLIAPSAEGNLL